MPTILFFTLFYPDIAILFSTLFFILKKIVFHIHYDNTKSSVDPILQQKWWKVIFSK